MKNIHHKINIKETDFISLTFVIYKYDLKHYIIPFHVTNY